MDLSPAVPCRGLSSLGPSPSSSELRGIVSSGLVPLLRPVCLCSLAGQPPALSPGPDIGEGGWLRMGPEPLLLPSCPAGAGSQRATVPHSCPWGRCPVLSERHPPARCQPNGRRGVRGGSRAGPSHGLSPHELVCSSGTGGLPPETSQGTSERWRHRLLGHTRPLPPLLAVSPCGLLVSVSLFIRTLILLDQGPILMTSLSPSHLKSPISKYNYIED